MAYCLARRLTLTVTLAGVVCASPSFLYGLTGFHGRCEVMTAAAQRKEGHHALQYVWLDWTELSFTVFYAGFRRSAGLVRQLSQTQL